MQKDDLIPRMLRGSELDIISTAESMVNMSRLDGNAVDNSFPYKLQQITVLIDKLTFQVDNLRFWRAQAEAAKLLEETERVIEDGNNQDTRTGGA
jgi:hypothetical protein